MCSTLCSYVCTRCERGCSSPPPGLVCDAYDRHHHVYLHALPFCPDKGRYGPDLGLICWGLDHACLLCIQHTPLSCISNCLTQGLMFYCLYANVMLTLAECKCKATTWQMGNVSSAQVFCAVCFLHCLTGTLQAWHTAAAHQECGIESAFCKVASIPLQIFSTPNFLFLCWQTQWCER